MLYHFKYCNVIWWSELVLVKKEKKENLHSITHSQSRFTWLWNLMDVQCKGIFKGHWQCCSCWRSALLMPFTCTVHSLPAQWSSQTEWPNSCWGNYRVCFLDILHVCHRPREQASRWLQLKIVYQTSRNVLERNTPCISVINWMVLNGFDLTLCYRWCSIWADPKWICMGHQLS